MTDILKIFITSGLTILGGLLTYTAGQSFVKFFIEPYSKYRELIGEIDHGLIVYANIIFNECFIESPEQLRSEAISVRSKIRDWSGRFSSLYNQLTLRERLVIAKLVPDKNEAKIVGQSLIRLSNLAGNVNGVGSNLEVIISDEEKVRLLLGIPK